ncbi:MAG: hypothetical protein WKF77_19210 [Planctomycetaceae bacterium]
MPTHIGQQIRTRIRFVEVVILQRCSTRASLAGGNSGSPQQHLGLRTDASPFRKLWFPPDSLRSVITDIAAGFDAEQRFHKIP